MWIKTERKFVDLSKYEEIRFFKCDGGYDLRVFKGIDGETIMRGLTEQDAKRLEMMIENFLRDKSKMLGFRRED